MLRILSFLVLLGGPVVAQVPRVVTDIAPIHALVSQIMLGVGEPQLIVRAGSSPHHHAMRPSEARMLAQADVVIWVGSGLTPWLEGPIASLATEAKVVRLLELAGANLLPFRDGALFDPHDQDVHGTGPVDPHLWLDPDNGLLFLNEISDLLSKLDPENAAAYAQNAALGRAEIGTAVREIDAQLAPLKDLPFIVLHDGFHYFEDHFGIEAMGAISASDAQTPGAARIKTLRAALQSSAVQCAFTEPGVGTRLLDTATQGIEIKVATLDPLGTEFALGSQLYVQMLRAMGRNIAGCLSR